MSRSDTGRPAASELRFGDLETFARILRAGSVNGAARSLGVGASGVSKALARLERHLGVKLVSRGAQGIALSDQGCRLAPRLLDLLNRSRELRGDEGGNELVVAAPSFLWALLAPRLGALAKESRIHAVETSSITMTALASQPLFDAAVSAGDDAWPESWVKVRAGVMRRALFAAPEHARRLGRRVTPKTLLGEVFVGRFVVEHGQLVESDDGCPLPQRERRFGHRAQTVAAALELARHSGELVFAPELAARTWVRRGALVEVEVDGWSAVEPVHVVCHRDRVTARAQRALTHAASAALAGAARER
jgi:DNA-binding transcriptional LysR family regulator